MYVRIATDYDEVGVNEEDIADLHQILCDNLSKGHRPNVNDSYISNNDVEIYISSVLNLLTFNQNYYE
jgi:hypothetical protein